MADSPTELIQKGISNPEAIPGFLSNKIHSQLCPLGIWANSRLKLGENVFNHEWDLLIILDCGRADMLRKVTDEYGFINEISEKRSVGSHSAEWMANTFKKEHIDKIRKTTYISSNPHSATVLENQLSHKYTGNVTGKIKLLSKWGKWDIATADELGAYHPIWKKEDEYIDFDYRYPSPRLVTDYGIATGRRDNFDRIILHYMPPHPPYIGREVREGVESVNPKSKQSETTEKHDKKTSLYLDNLRWALDEVSILLQNINRNNVVITADHGDAHGEYGINSHDPGSFHPKVKKVPWIETTATDLKTYEPKISLKESDHSVGELLKSLGYKA